MICKHDHSDAGSCKGCKIMTEREETFTVYITVKGDSFCQQSFYDLAEQGLKKKMDSLLEEDVTVDDDKCNLLEIKKAEVI